MYLGIITGGPGSGKSEHIECLIEKATALGKRALVVVPERFSHIEERTLCMRFGGLGVNGIEVSTFSKLARQMSAEGEHLRASGREMMILKSAKMNADAGDGIFGDSYERSGFVEKLSETIGELKRSLVTPDMLESFEVKGLTGRKISALSAIYKSYNEMFGDNLKDPDSNMQELANAIENCDLSDTYVFIDGFSDFMPAHYLVIESLVKNADKVFVALTISDSGLRDSEGIFAPVSASMNRIAKSASELGAVCEYTQLDGEYSYINADDIKFFLSNYEQYTPFAYKPKCENIKLDICANPRDEAERLAGRIMHEVRENGMRFKDIGVIIGNTDRYSHIIDAVFDEYKIPFFTDRKISAVEHPVIRTVLSVFRIITENWSYQSVFEYLRSGFVYKKIGDKVVGIDQRAIDKLELYCKTRGVRGKNVWLSEDEWKPLKKGLFDEATDNRHHEEDISALDSLRRELMAPFVTLMQKIQGKRKVRQLATALFEFLEEIHLYEGLKSEQARFEDMNMLADAARIGDVWGAVLETLDQAVMISGDEFVSRDDFVRMLEAGFSKCSVDTVPPGTDCVSVASAGMSRPVRVKALFVLGAVRGELPPEVSDGGIITDADRAVLSESGYDCLQKRQTKMQIAEFNLFSSLTAACEKIYISYPEMNDEGTKNTPAALVGELLRTFDDIDTTYNEDTEWENILASGRSTYRKLISRITADISDAERDFWDSIWEYTSSEDKRAEQVSVSKAKDDADLSVFDEAEGERKDIVSMLSDYKEGRTHIRPEIADKLYSGRKLSITSMEKYNQCPFSYFARYGLSLGEEGEYKVGGSDIGKMVHWAVCEYCRKVQENADTVAEKKARWEKLTDARSEEIVAEIIKGIEEKSLEANPDFLPERLDVMCRRVEKTINRSAKVIRDSITAGAFAAVEFEKRFDFVLEKGGESVALEGAIDRLDIAEDESGKLLRIIDYKTGDNKFSVADIYNKTSLQLIIYALAAADMYKEENGRVAAVLYDKIRDELIKTKVGSPVAIAAAPLDGVIVTDSEATQDEEIILHDITLAEKDAKSSFLPLQTKKGGGLRKSTFVISRDRFDMLTRYVAKTAIETKRNVLGGYIEAIPLGDDEKHSPCAWCEYSAICLHSKDKDRTRAKVTAATKAWEKIETEDTNG